MRATRHVLLAAPAAAIFLLAPPAPAQAATSCDRVASPTGSDTAAGTLASPYRSAAKLAGSLASGQTGCFRAGTYSFGTLSLKTAGTTLAPYGSEAVTLAGHIKALPTAQNSVIEGMTLDASSSPDNQIGPKVYASGFVLRDNQITNRNTEICVLVSAFDSEPAPEGVVIERNRIHHCGALPSTNMDHGIYLSAARNTIVRDNWIYQNADRGVQQYPDVQGTRITGNVIANNGAGVNFSGTGNLVTKNALVEGNVVVYPKRGYNAYSGGDGPDGTNNFFRDNCVHTTSGGSGIEPGTRSFDAAGNLVAPPHLMAPAEGDYRLRSTSGCLSKYAGTMSRVGAPVPPASSARPLGRVKLRTRDRSVRKGRRIKLRGRVPAGLVATERVAIERRRGHRWRRMTKVRLGGDRRFSKRIRARTTGRLTLRAVSLGARARGSQRVRIRVRRR